VSLVNILTAPAGRDDPKYRMDLATKLEGVAMLHSLETGRTYYRPTLGPEAMAAIIRALRGI